jgi:hypothetical protein
MHPCASLGARALLMNYFENTLKHIRTQAALSIPLKHSFFLALLNIIAPAWEHLSI